MVDLSKYKKQSTEQKISSKIMSQHHRPYLGVSQLGHSCERYLWFSFRWCYTATYPSRMKRLFDRGHREEPVIIKMLKEVGITCYDDQKEVSAVYDHVKGHCDGKSIGVIEAPKTVHLNEFKTMSDKYFKELIKEGLKASKPVYYCQIQVYMKLFKLKRGLFVAVNKNDDNIYIERVYFDDEYATSMLKRAENIILDDTPPTRKFPPTWYECKWCDAKNICNDTSAVDKNCRTCEQCNILTSGKWECEKYDELQLSTSQQRLACKHYELLYTLRVN